MKHNICLCVELGHKCEYNKDTFCTKKGSCKFKIISVKKASKILCLECPKANFNIDNNGMPKCLRTCPYINKKSQISYWIKKDKK